MSTLYRYSKNKSFAPKTKSPTIWKKMTVKLVSGGADAFIEQKIDTNADENTRKVMTVHAINAHFDVAEQHDLGNFIVQVS